MFRVQYKFKNDLEIIKNAFLDTLLVVASSIFNFCSFEGFVFIKGVFIKLSVIVYLFVCIKYGGMVLYQRLYWCSYSQHFRNLFILGKLLIHIFI